MADDDRYQRGVEMIKEVYAGDVVAPPKGTMAFSDLMLESLFAEVWTREVLIMLANYAGYPRAAALISIVEQQIAAVANEQEEKGDS